jgi:geranylgeranyl diphosphate synthase type I
MDDFINKAKTPHLKLNYRFIKEYVLAGGKRLRPIALIMAYHAVDGQDEDSIYLPSLSVELFHNSTLIHDDIMDEDELRRKKPTVYKRLKDWFNDNHNDLDYNGSLFNSISSRFAVSNSIICGNLLYSAGIKCLLQTKNIKETLSVYEENFRAVNDGQVLDISYSYKKNISEKEYFEMITKKTAKLFVASVEIGAILGDASKEQLKCLSDYALQIATAFQIKDDIMDISPNMGKGHDLGSDIKKGKNTLLIIKALELSDDQQKKIIQTTLGKEDASPDEIMEVIEIINNVGALKYAEELAEKKAEEGKKALTNCNLKKEAVEFFNDLADYMVSRRI